MYPRMDTDRVTSQEIYMLKIKQQINGGSSMEKAIFSFLALCLLGSNIFAGEKELKEKLKNMQEQEKRGQEAVVDVLLRKEIENFLLNNQTIPVKNFKKFRLATNASRAIVKDLNQKYAADPENYLLKITNKTDRDIYRLALKYLYKDYYDKFYICKGEDEKKVKESWGKVDKLRDQVSSILKKDTSMQSSDEIIKLNEKILDECRFEGAEFSLLYAYRDRGEKEEKYRKKFNELMLRMIADDQINYDYLYEGLDSRNSGFISQYFLFFNNVNSLKAKLILSKEQVKFLAEAILDKHREVFNLRYYYIPEENRYDQYAVSDAIQSMVNLSTWLKHYKLDDLNEKIIKRFFDDEFVMMTMRYTPWFKDFWEDLIKRADFEKYKEE